MLVPQHASHKNLNKIASRVGHFKNEQNHIKCTIVYSIMFFPNYRIELFKVYFIMKCYTNFMWGTREVREFFWNLELIYIVFFLCRRMINNSIHWSGLNKIKLLLIKTKDFLPFRRTKLKVISRKHLLLGNDASSGNQKHYHEWTLFSRLISHVIYCNWCSII